MILIILFSVFILFLVVFSIDEEAEYQTYLREKINKRLLYGLSALLILGYSLFSPFYKASALDNNKPAPFNKTKTLYVGAGSKVKMDVTKYWSILLFSNRDSYDNHRIKWQCSSFTREQAFTSYKKAIANNAGWLITQSEGASEKYINSYETAVVPYSIVSIYWSESNPDEQILKYSKGAYLWDFSSSVYYDTRALSISYDHLSDTILVGCSKPVSRAFLSGHNYFIDPYWVSKGHFDNTSTYLNTFPYKLDKDITWDIGFIPDSEEQTLYPHFEYD